MFFSFSLFCVIFSFLILAVVFFVSHLINSSVFSFVLRYVELECLYLSVSWFVFSFFVLSSIVFLIWSFVFWSVIIVFCIGVHVVYPSGFLGFLPFMFWFWISLGCISLFFIPIFGFGFYGFLHVISTFVYNQYLLAAVCFCSNFYLTFYFWYWFIFVDLLCFSSVFVGFWSLCNWLYQVFYFACSLWLVFVLHAFWLSCFSELFWVLLDLCFYGSFIPFGGLVCLSLFMGFLMFGYLAIQLYVYISFSLSFVFYTVFGWYSTVILVPVCLVDAFSFDVFFFSSLCMLSFILFFNFFFSFVFLSFSFVLNHYFRFDFS